MILKNTYCQQVIELIKQRIKDGTLRPGDKVSEVSLAKECGISRAPIREALLSLEVHGFLSSDIKKGKFVTKVTPESILSSYEVSGLLEAKALYTSVIHMNEQDWQQTEIILEALKDNITKADTDDNKAELSTAFHDQMLIKATNPLLVITAKKYGHIYSKFLMYNEWKSLYNAEEMYTRHLDLYMATKSYNEVHIRQAVLDHYEDSSSRLVSKITNK